MFNSVAFCFMASRLSPSPTINARIFLDVFSETFFNPSKNKE